LDESSTKRRAATLQPECHQFDHILFRSWLFSLWLLHVYYVCAIASSHYCPFWCKMHDISCAWSVTCQSNTEWGTINLHALALFFLSCFAALTI
jgi:hypothetical protein